LRCWKAFAAHRRKRRDPRNSWPRTARPHALQNRLVPCRRKITCKGQIQFRTPYHRPWLPPHPQFSDITFGISCGAKRRRLHAVVRPCHSNVSLAGLSPR
jgi:hypothetical protein